jgi:hypothetical protein
VILVEGLFDLAVLLAGRLSTHQLRLRHSPDPDATGATVRPARPHRVYRIRFRSGRTKRRLRFGATTPPYAFERENGRSACRARPQQLLRCRRFRR